MNIGFLLNHLGDSPLTKAFIESSNAVICADQGVDIIAFVNNQVRPTKFPVFASMNINEAFDYRGAVIASDINLAAKLAKFPGPRRRYYYLWELDWTKAKVDGFSFEEMLEVFHNPKLSIIARTEEDKKLIEQCWNCRVDAVIPKCDMRAFVEKIRQDEK